MVACWGPKGWNSPPPILEHFCPLFVQIAKLGLILPSWSFILPRIPPPVLYSAVTHPFCGYVHTQNTPNTTPKHRPELESRRRATVWATLTATGQFVWRVGKLENFSRSEQKKILFITPKLPKQGSLFRVSYKVILTKMMWLVALVTLIMLAWYVKLGYPKSGI